MNAQTTDGVIVTKGGHRYYLRDYDNEWAIVLSMKGPLPQMAEDFCPGHTSEKRVQKLPQMRISPVKRNSDYG